MKKILIVGPAWVGDMVMAQCLFKAIKALDNTVIIDVLAPTWSFPLIERMPEVRQAHVMPIGHGSLQLKERYLLAKKLAPEAYDQAIVLPNSWKSALIPFWANIPKRTGFLGEWRFGLLNDIRMLNKKHLPRMIDRFVALAYKRAETIHQPIIFPHLALDKGTVAATAEKFSIHTQIAQPILALCPGAEFGASKRWPESYYAEIALQKLKAGWSVWIFGSKNDTNVAALIQAQTHHQCVDFTGKTNLGEAIDLLSLSSALVTNDSGLMHIAAALQKPLIAIYGSTDPSFTPPLGAASEIVRLALPCSPCFKRECPLGHHQCMQDLRPDIVLSVMDKAGMV